MFNYVTWTHVANTGAGQTSNFVDGLLADGIQTVCESIELGIFNSFLADKVIFLNTVSVNKVHLVNSSFRGDVKGNYMQGGFKVFARAAPQITVDNCSFENLKYTDSFFPILYKHSKLCKYDTGAISVQMVSTSDNSVSTGYLQIKQSTFVENMGALAISVTGKQKNYAKVNVNITDSTFEKNFNLGTGGALSFVKGINNVNLEGNVFKRNNVGALRNIHVRTGTEYYCSSFKYTPISYSVKYGGAGVELDVHVSNCTKDFKLCGHGEARKIAITFEGNGGAIALEEGMISMKRCSFSANSATVFGDSLYFGERTGYSMDECVVSTMAIPYRRAYNIYAASTHGSEITNSVFTVISVHSIPVSILYHNTRETVDNVFVRNMSLNCPASTFINFANGTAQDPFGTRGHDQRTRETSLIGFIDLMFWCSLCSKDTYSLSGDRFNIDVINGSASLTYDSITCLKCPYGAVCSVKVRPKPNTWGQIEGHAIKMYSCPGGYCCTGSDCYNYNSCAKHRGSTLCGNCIRGYSEALFSPRCIPNTECSLLPFLLMLFGFGITYLVVFIFQKDLKDFLFAPLHQNKKPVRLNGVRKPVVSDDQSVSTVGDEANNSNPSATNVLRNIYVTDTEPDEVVLKETIINRAESLKTRSMDSEVITSSEQDVTTASNGQPSVSGNGAAQIHPPRVNNKLPCREVDEGQNSGGIFFDIAVLLFPGRGPGAY